MEQIGYSVVTDDGKESSFWGDIAGQMEGVPERVTWPNGDVTHCPEIGMSVSGSTLVPRFINVLNGQAAPDVITFDGKQILVTRTIEETPRLVPKYVIVDRLQAAGLLEAARSAIDAADLYTQERWNARDAIYANDPTATALLTKIGAIPSEILSP